jgi:competence protein CoiA
MQIYAFNTRGLLLHVTQASRGTIYTCPECAAAVRPRGGGVRRLHFYHLQATSCRLHGKSITHLHIQYALQNMLAPEQVFLEHHFPQIGRRADVYWPAQKIVFEVQLSPISAEEVSARTRDYNKIGYQVIWILHDSRFNRTRMSDAEIQLRSSPHYFTNMTAFGKGIFYDQYAHIHNKVRQKRSNRFPVHFKNVIPVNLKQLPRQFPQERKKWPISFEGDLFNRAWNCKMPTKTFPSLLKWLGSLYRIIFHLLLEKTTY